MRVGEVAERAGVNVETLRYYERRGLLPEPERMPSGHRRYDEETVRFLRAIKEAQSVGFTLAEIGDYLGAARRSGLPSETLRVRMAAKIDEIDGRIAGLRRMREELARVVGCACDSLDHCTCGAAYLARRGRETSAPPALLHVTNGESAGNTLRQTGLGGAVLPWQDVLHEGPVPDTGRAELLQVRAKFLSECGWGRRTTIRSSLERRDRQLRAALRDGSRLVLWFEHDLYDQLQLLDVLALAHGLEGSLESIVVDAFPGKPSFRGLGELTPDELETLWPERREVTAETLKEAAVAWDVFRAPDPAGLAELVTRDSKQLPFLAAALQRLLEELPDVADGLSRTERQALQVVAGDARTPMGAFLATQELEEAPFLGDAWFYRALSTIGQGDERLLETEEGEPLPPAPPLSDGQEFAWLALRVTPSGERVLGGEADRVELIGVDRWLGGSHVTAESGWRWDSAARQLRA
jgi:DNA-binding transcriptional MerR regulator